MYKLQFIKTKANNKPWYDTPSNEIAIAYTHLIDSYCPRDKQKVTRTDTTQTIDYLFDNVDDALALHKLITASNNQAVKAFWDYKNTLDKKLGVSYKKEWKLFEIK